MLHVVFSSAACEILSKLIILNKHKREGSFECYIFSCVKLRTSVGAIFLMYQQVRLEDKGTGISGLFFSALTEM